VSPARGSASMGPRVQPPPAPLSNREGCPDHQVGQPGCASQLGAPPTPEPIYDGLVNGDSEPATPPTCTADAATNRTHCAGAADPNYTISYADGALTSTA